MYGCFYLYQKMKIKYILLPFFLLHCFISAAQTDQLWTRYTLSKKIKRVYLSAEYQYRSQGKENLSHVFDDPMLHSYRLWLHFDFNEHLKLVSAPVSHFRHITVEEVNEIKTIHAVNEFRTMLGLEYKIDMKHSVNLKNRLATEYRDYYEKHTDLFRFRYLLSLTSHLNKHFDFIAFNEVFFNGHQKKMDFDHNRSGANISYKHHQSFTIDVGYFVAIKNNHSRSHVINVMFNKIL